MYHVYVLYSLKDKKLYVGFTRDLKLRFKKHEAGLVQSTKSRRPFKLIYYESCINKKDALHRERYLKTHYGRMFIKNRLKHWYACVS